MGVAMDKQKIVGGTGIIAGRNVTFGDVNSPVAIGENIIQIINQNGTKSWLYSQGFRPPTDSDNIFGRQEELEEIDEFLNQNSALAITGFRGTGKSTLASMYTDRVQKRGEFAGIYWRKVDETIDISDVVGSFFTVIGKPIQDLGRYKVEELINRLFVELNAAPYFLVLDNFETLLNPITNKPINAGFSDLIEKAAQSAGKSRVIFTSWECPASERGIRPKYNTIGGLDASAAVQLLRSKGLKEPDDELKKAIELCGGHPLALILLVQLVEGGEETFSSILKDNILWEGEVAENILDKVYNERLSEEERKLLQYISLYRLPVPLQSIVAVNESNWTKAKVKKIALGLKRKSLLQNNEEYYWEESLIDAYAYNKLADNIERHKCACKYYLSLHLPEICTKKEDIQSLIEAHYHACMAKGYDEAASIIFHYKLNVYLDTWGNYKALIELYTGLLPKNPLKDTPLLDNIVQSLVLCELGRIYYLIGHVETSLKYSEKALAIAQEINNTHNEGACLRNIGNVYKHMGQMERAIEYFEKALEIARKKCVKQNEGICLGEIGNCYRNMGQVETSIEYSEKALAIAIEINDTHHEGLWLGNIGNAYNNIGQIKRAVEYYEKALAFAKKIGDKHNEGTWLGNIGNAYTRLGQMEKAIEYSEASQVIAKEIGDRDGEGVSLGNIGIFYLQMGQMEKAIEYFEMGLEIAKNIGDKRGEENHLRNLGASYGEMKRVEKAIEYSEKALIIAKEIDDRDSEGICLGNLGNYYAQIKQIDKAIEYFKNGLSIAKNISNRYIENTILGNLGEVYYHRGEVEKAIEYYELALDVVQEIDNKYNEKVWLRCLGDIFFNQRQMEKAIEYYETALSISHDIGDMRGERDLIGYLGIAYNINGDVEKAIKYYEKGLVIVREIGDERAEGDYLINLDVTFGEKEFEILLAEGAPRAEKMLMKKE